METPEITPSKTNGGKAATAADAEPAVKSKVATYEVVATSLSPMLQDAMSEDEVERILIEGDRPAKVTGIPRRERAGKKLYVGPSGECGIPSSVLLAAMREAGRRVKVGKAAISTATTTVLYSIVRIEQEFLPFPKECQEWIPDIRRGQMNSGAGKKVTVGLCRPKFPKWGFECTVVVNYGVLQGLTEQHIKQLFEIAGTLIGVGSYRPSCKGPFGCFELKGLKLVKGSAR